MYIYIYTLLYIIYTYSHSYINVIYIICILYIHCVQLHECKSISASHPVLGLGNGPNNVRSRRRRCLPSLVLFAKRFIIHLLSSIHVCVWVFGAQAHLHPSASFWGWNPVVSRKQSAMFGNQYGPWNWYKFHDQVRPSPGNSAGDCLQALFQPLESNVSAQSEIGDRPGLKDSWTGHTALLIQENFCKPRLSEALTSLIFGKLEVLPVPTV